MQYRYTLDKSPKKYICPKCHKKTFVRVIDITTGDLAPDSFGRCDRETNCGYMEIPKSDGTTVSAPDYTPPPPKPTTYHLYELLSATAKGYKENNFIQFLKTLFTPEQVKEAIQRYLIGTSKKWNGATVFWQIDDQQRIRGGKIMQYNPNTGKRIKTLEGKPLITWVHSELKLKDFNLSQCLFGLHTVNEVGNKTVAIVESEKTAIIMSLFKPEYAWLATGAKNGFKLQLLKSIKNKTIIGFPDKGCFSEWSLTAIELNRNGYNITVSDLLERASDIKQGEDLADAFILADANDKAAPVVEPQQPKRGFNPIELAVHELEQHNPAIRTLINAFDLTDTYGREIRKVV